jgi:hypothetical protein
MKKLITILLVLIILGLIGGVAVYFYINKPQKDYEKSNPDFVIAAKTLYINYKDEKVKSQKEYDGKLIQIKGSIKKVELNDSKAIVVFVFEQGDFGDEGIRCTMLPKFNKEIQDYKSGDFLVIKGYCTGYNDTDVIFDKCSLVQ